MCQLLVVWYSCDHVFSGKVGCPYDGTTHENNNPTHTMLPTACWLCNQPETEQIRKAKVNQLTATHLEFILGGDKTATGFMDMVTRFFARGDHKHFGQDGPAEISNANDGYFQQLDQQTKSIRAKYGTVILARAPRFATNQPGYVFDLAFDHWHNDPVNTATINANNVPVSECFFPNAMNGMGQYPAADFNSNGVNDMGQNAFSQPVANGFNGINDGNSSQPTAENFNVNGQHAVEQPTSNDFNGMAQNGFVQSTAENFNSGDQNVFAQLIVEGANDMDQPAPVQDVVEESNGVAENTIAQLTTGDLGQSSPVQHVDEESKDIDLHASQPVAQPAENSNVASEQAIVETSNGIGQDGSASHVEETSQDMAQSPPAPQDNIGSLVENRDFEQLFGTNGMSADDLKLLADVAYGQPRPAADNGMAETDFELFIDQDRVGSPAFAAHVTSSAKGATVEKFVGVENLELIPNDDVLLAIGASDPLPAFHENFEVVQNVPSTPTIDPRLLDPNMSMEGPLPSPQPVCHIREKARPASPDTINPTVLQNEEHMVFEQEAQLSTPEAPVETQSPAPLSAAPQVEESVQESKAIKRPAATKTVQFTTPEKKNQGVACMTPAQTPAENAHNQNHQHQRTTSTSNVRVQPATQNKEVQNKQQHMPMTPAKTPARRSKKSKKGSEAVTISDSPATPSKRAPKKRARVEKSHPRTLSAMPGFKPPPVQGFQMRTEIPRFNDNNSNSSAEVPTPTPAPGRVSSASQMPPPPAPATPHQIQAPQMPNAPRKRTASAADVNGGENGGKKQKTQAELNVSPSPAPTTMTFDTRRFQGANKKQDGANKRPRKTVKIIDNQNVVNQNAAANHTFLVNQDAVGNQNMAANHTSPVNQNVGANHVFPVTQDLQNVDLNQSFVATDQAPVNPNMAVQNMVQAQQTQDKPVDYKMPQYLLELMPHYRYQRAVELKRAAAERDAAMKAEKEAAMQAQMQAEMQAQMSQQMGFNMNGNGCFAQGYRFPQGHGFGYGQAYPQGMMGMQGQGGFVQQ